MSKALTILGSTGTIGDSTLKVLSLHPDKFSLFALTAYSNCEKMFQQCVVWEPEYAVMVEEKAADALERKVKKAGLKVQVIWGLAGLEYVASHPNTDYVMAGIVGAAGLLPNLAAAQAGKRVMLANKESLVMSGQLFMNAVEENGAQLLPIDSEHNAIFQCLPSIENKGEGSTTKGVKKIILTASGGPFREKTLKQLERVTPNEACAHPNWMMGQKISVDSASMMNKGLEVIEACWLFNVKCSDVQVVIHPESIIHSMVEYVDGSIISQMGNPDMRTPIAYSLLWPERGESGVSSLDLFSVKQLNFEEPDPLRFPCLKLAQDAIRTGGTAPAVLNAANEVAVAAFLNAQIKFTDIPHIVESALSSHSVKEADTIDLILSVDQETRQEVGSKIKTI